MDIEKAAEDLHAMYEDLYSMIDGWAGDGMSSPAIGAALLSTALRLYRTTLSDEDYNKFMDYLSETRDRIEKFDLEEAKRSLN